MPDRTLLMGAVAYDPKVVTIWNGFRSWLGDRDFPFDYLLYSNYERQVDDLLADRIDLAWNSPLAWLRSDRLARARGTAVSAIVMRDTDRDLSSVIVVKAGSGIDAVSDLVGKVVAVGAVDSPQATLLPVSHLRASGLEPGRDITVRRFDVGVGLHGDHVGGERDAARALAAGEVDAACMIDANHLQFVQEGTLPAGSTKILAQTSSYDHCNMTTAPAAPAELVEEFGRLLLSMSYDDPVARRLLDLEGLTAWEPGRTSMYGLLDAAVDEVGFYAADGTVIAHDHRP